jgi:hypothetical protein
MLTFRAVLLFLCVGFLSPFGGCQSVPPRAKGPQAQVHITPLDITKNVLLAKKPLRPWERRPRVEWYTEVDELEALRPYVEASLFRMIWQRAVRLDHANRRFDHYDSHSQMIVGELRGPNIFTGSYEYPGDRAFHFVPHGDTAEVRMRDLSDRGVHLLATLKFRRIDGRWMLEDGEIVGKRSDTGAQWQMNLREKLKKAIRLLGRLKGWRNA